MIYLLILPFIAFGIISDHAGVLWGACSGAGVLALEIAWLIMLGVRLDSRRTALEKQSAPVGSFIDKKRSYRMCYKPDVVEFGKITLEATISIAKDNHVVIEKLRACGALIENCWNESERYADLLRIPSGLLRTLISEPFEQLEFRVRVKHGYSYITDATGTFIEIRCMLENFLMSPIGEINVAQERGEFIYGQFFTKDTYFCISRGYEDNHVEVMAISRLNLGVAIREEMTMLKAILNDDLFDGLPAEPK